MKFYINDSVSFSNTGIAPITLEYLSEDISITNLNDQEALKGKGFRNIPRIYKLFHIIVNKILHKYKWEDLSKLGLINAYEIANLKASIDFENEIVIYGIQGANPLKGPLTVSNACAGWLAIRNGLYGLNITVNNGACSVLTALSIAKNHMHSGCIEACLILSANQKGSIYDQYERSNVGCSEFANGILLSTEKSKNSLMEIISIRNYSLNNDLDILSIVETGCKEGEFTIIEGTLDGMCLNNVCNLNNLFPERKQFSLFPIFLQNMKDIFAKSFNKSLEIGDIINYTIIDPNGSESIIKLKKI
jgi:hypothetical protein